MAGGAAAVAVSFLLRILAGGLFLPELASQTLFSLTPGFLESKAVENLGPLAKYSAFVGASIGNVFLLGLVAYFIQRFERTPKSRLGRVLALTIIPFAIMSALGVLFISVAQVSSQPPTLVALALSLIVPSLVFGAATGYRGIASSGRNVVCIPEQGGPKPFNRKRRLFIKAAGGAAVAAVILYYGVGLLFSKVQLSPGADETSSILRSSVTPNDQFYRVDVNVFPPSVDSKAWNLKLHGLVSNPMLITYDSLISMPSAEEYATLECVSNKIGGDLMSTALWRGVKLKDLLRMAGVSSTAEYVVFRCYDGYDVGVPLDRSMMDGAILAYQINGEKLPVEHGYPVRAIVPGLYGMMNAKWVTEIELVNRVYAGFWQRRGWTNTALYQTGSTIITPGTSALRDRFSLPPSLTDISGSPIPVAGVAFAGDRGIAKVEVSTDDGKTWQTASLNDPLSNYTWVFWKLEWNPPLTGQYRLIVRATDGTGETQTATLRDPFPDGATGYHVVDVTVRTAT